MSLNNVVKNKIHKQVVDEANKQAVSQNRCKMKDFLNKVRESKKDDNLKKKIIITILIFVIGIILGIFSKYASKELVDKEKDAFKIAMVQKHE